MWLQRGLAVKITNKNAVFSGCYASSNYYGLVPQSQIQALFQLTYSSSVNEKICFAGKKGI